MRADMEAIRDRLLLDGFVPKELTPPAAEERSLFSAVRLAHEMRVDDADVCYWNWRGLREQLSEVWAALDAEASERNGRPIQAHVWTFPKSRTLDEVVSLVEAADGRLSNRWVGWEFRARRRPDALGMIASNKARGAIASTLGVLHVAQAKPMGSVIAEALEWLNPDSNDEELLEHLDEIVLLVDGMWVPTDKSEIPKLLSRYFGEAIERQRKLDVQEKLEEPRWTFTKFLTHVVDQGRAHRSDIELTEWLKSKSPDPVPRTRPIPPSDEHQRQALQAYRSTAPSRIGVARTFAAIDVETANADRASVCAIGVAVVNDGAIVDRRRWLCKPPPGFDHFSPFNIGIHGIRAKDIAEAPSFAEAMAEAIALIDGKAVVAHNASFDIGAIHRACAASDADVPEFDYACTMTMARSTFGFPTYGLAWCADHFGIPLDHHDPTSDAVASALLALAIADDQGLAGLDDLMEQCQLRWGHLSAVGWLHALRAKPSTRRKRPPEANPNADPLHPLYGVYVSFTGDMVVLTRSQAFERLAELGAQGLANVTRATQMLVVGDLNPAVLRPGADVTGKMRRAFELQAEGQSIEVISGHDFFAMLD